MSGLDQISRRQLSLGIADWFRPYPEPPPGPYNQIRLQAGWFNQKGTRVAFPKADTASPSFSPVTAGKYRFDLVYLDANGDPQIEQGDEKLLPVVNYSGAPGQSGSTKKIGEGRFPIAYVLIEETGIANVVVDDITDIRGIMQDTVPGLDGDVQPDDATGRIAGNPASPNWKRVGAGHVHPLSVDDGTLPLDTDRTGPALPGAVDKYARNDHVHKVDPTLVADVNLLLGATSAYLDRADTLVFLPDHTTEYYRKYFLHVFQGRMREYPSGAPSSLWINHKGTDAPLPVTLDTIEGPEHTDSGAPYPGGFPDWYFAYLISTADGATYKMVFSNRGPNQGPDLSGAPFTGPGYVRWRYIGAVRQIADGSVPARQFEIPPVAKIGRHSQYLFAQDYLPPILGGWNPYDLSDTVPPTSMRVNLEILASAGNGNISLQVRPPGTWGMLNPCRQIIRKMNVSQGWDEENSESRYAAWVRTDEDQFIEYNNYDVAGAAYGHRIYVLGYEEYADDLGSEVY